MGCYGRVVVPRLIALAMRNQRLAPLRERVARGAEGRVVELGIGPGLNLPLYGPAVEEVVGIDPSLTLLDRARPRAQGLPFPVRLVEGVAERLPLGDASADTVVTTWTLCSVADIAAGLAEARRILRPGGRLLFAEHGLAPDEAVARWQHRITPLWRRIAGGCHIDRAMDRAITAAGFRLEHLETGYLGTPRLMTFMYSGSARPS
jgi:ubiquinone/menaquinone biosynthesis C-methylase UbiE